MVIQGMQLYTDALRKSRLQSNYQIRRIQRKDYAKVARVIRDVTTEFQATGKGYSIDDIDVGDMYSCYRAKRSYYYVPILNDTVVGCGGFAALTGGGKVTCELRKMFLLPQTRGLGLGRRLLTMLLNEARKCGYKKCYIETRDRMWRANEFYKKNGFKLLDSPQGKIGHCRCDRWYLLSLCYQT